ncbi:MAG: phosphotransferase [Bacteroidota bacterium]
MENHILQPPPVFKPVDLNASEDVLNKIILRGDVPEEKDEIISRLVQKALLSGISITHEVTGKSNRATEGSVADLVMHAHANISFVIKFDKNKTLLDEAYALKMMQNRLKLPKGFYKNFPKIYAIKHDKPPYAYIMQGFNIASFSDYIFKARNPKNLVVKGTQEILKTLVPAYQATIDRNTMPNIKNIYVDRIVQRLEEARNHDPNFRKTSTASIVINNKRYERPEFYLEQINQNLSDYKVDFTTFVHGDCHPENILYGVDKAGKSIVRFIDVKDWYCSDYMFDIGKITHYLFATGPSQIIAQPPLIKTDFQSLNFNYKLDQKDYFVDEMIQRILKKVEGFAIKNNDITWKKRYLLSVASNLLGLPVSKSDKVWRPTKNQCSLYSVLRRSY